MPTKKEHVEKELEKMYDNQTAWLEVGKLLHNRIHVSLQESPKLNLLLKLSILANFGIWSTFIFVTIFL
jgi:hypothetical protein